MSFLIRSHFCCCNKWKSQEAFAPLAAVLWDLHVVQTCSWLRTSTCCLNSLWASSLGLSLAFISSSNSADMGMEICRKDNRNQFQRPDVRFQLTFWNQKNKYFIGMLSVELLYLFESVVELCKLIWSWDGWKFVSPHSVRQIIQEHEKNKRKSSGQLVFQKQQSCIHPWTFQEPMEVHADQALNHLYSDSGLLQSVCTVLLHSCENSVTVQSSQSVSPFVL